MSDAHSPSPNRSTSHSANSEEVVQTSTGEAPVPSASVLSRAAESKDTSPSPVQPQSREQCAPAATDEQPPQQADPQTTSNGPRNPASFGDNGPPQPPKKDENHRLLGIPAYQGHSHVDRSYDYMQKYPPDEKGKELESDARVWKVYLDECESYDNDMIRSFRDTIDSLLVFAALFSSVVTGFVVQTSQALEPDYAQIGAHLLFEQIQVLRAAGNATAIQEIPSSPLTPDSMTHSTLDVIINWLFFASLAFSLATAFIAVLIKQWLQAFTALIPGDAKQRSLTRQFRFTGLQKWKLPELINILPLFLHFSLAFFLIGLCVFVSRFHLSMPIMIGVVTFAVIAFYIITGILPAVHLDCPYRLTILYIPGCLAVYAFRMIHFKMSGPLRQIHIKIFKPIHRIIVKISKQLRRIYAEISRPRQRIYSIISKQLQRLTSDMLPSSSKPADSMLGPSLSLSPLHSQEQTLISHETTTLKLEGLSLTWLFDQTPNTSVRRISIYAVRRFLEADLFEYIFEIENNTLFNNKPQRATHLRDSLPLDSMSTAAIRAFTVEKNSEDISLLHDAIILFRQCSNRILLPISEWHHAVNNPRAVEFLKEKVFQISSDPEESLASVMKMIEEAIDRDNWDAAIYLLWTLREPHLKLRLPSGNTILRAAFTSHKISHEDRATIFSIAMEGGIDFNTFTRTDYHDKRTVLHDVLHRGTLAALQHLISHVPNLDLNVRLSLSHSTPLHFAYYRDNGYPENVATTLSMVEILLENGANAQLQDVRRQTPLQLFCRDLDLTFPIIQKLLSAGADPNILDDHGQLPLHLACERGFRSFVCTKQGLNVMEALIAATKDINKLSKEGNTPLDLLEESDGYRENKEEAKAGYSLMRKHGAMLANELQQANEESPPSVVSEGQSAKESAQDDEDEPESAIADQSNPAPNVE